MTQTDQTSKKKFVTQSKKDDYLLFSLYLEYFVSFNVLFWLFATVRYKFWRLICSFLYGIDTSEDHITIYTNSNFTGHIQFSLVFLTKLFRPSKSTLIWHKNILLHH